MDTLYYFPSQISDATNLLHGSAINCSSIYYDALKNPHIYVTFATIGYNTIKALTTLEAILKTRSKSL
jgi:hypothetical protein